MKFDTGVRNLIFGLHRPGYLHVNLTDMENSHMQIQLDTDSITLRSDKIDLAKVGTQIGALSSKASATAAVDEGTRILERERLITDKDSKAISTYAEALRRSAETGQPFQSASEILDLRDLSSVAQSIIKVTEATTTEQHASSDSGPGPTYKDVMTLGGTVEGAIIGGILGGPAGAGVGAAIGAAAGAVVGALADAEEERDEAGGGGDDDGDSDGGGEDGGDGE